MMTDIFGLPTLGDVIDSELTIWHFIAVVIFCCLITYAMFTFSAWWYYAGEKTLTDILAGQKDWIFNVTQDILKKVVLLKL